MAAQRTDLAQRFSRLTDAQRALLNHRLQDRTTPPVSGAETESGTEDGGPHALTPTQFGIWLFESMNPGTSAYHNPAAVRLRGPVDEDALRAALQSIQDRHEPLRSRWPQDEDGTPQAVVEARGTLRVPWRVADLTAEPDPEAAAAEVLRAEAAKPFRLDRGPVWRCLMVRLGPEDRILAIMLHHIVSDGGSLGVLLGELARIYAARRDGEDAPLPPLRRGYFAVAAETAAHSAAGRAELDHWLRTLDSAPDRIDLDALAAAAPPATEAGSLRGRERFLHLPDAVASALEQRCAHASASLFAGLVAGFAATLNRVSGQSDLVLTTPVDQRGTQGRDLIGCFVNTVALRLRVTPDTTLGALLEQAAAALSDALDHSGLPFADLVAALAHDRTRADRPFGNVAVVHNNAPFDRLELAGLSLEHYPLAPPEVKHDLALSWARTRAGLAGRLEYAEHVPQPAIDRLSRHVTSTLISLARSPETRIADLGTVMDPAQDSA